MTDYDRLENQYRNDPMFAQIVKTLISLMETLQLTPYEVRNIAMFAVMKFEMTKPYTIPIMLDPNLKENEFFFTTEAERQRKFDLIKQFTNTTIEPEE